MHASTRNHHLTVSGQYKPSPKAVRNGLIMGTLPILCMIIVFPVLDAVYPQSLSTSTNVSNQHHSRQPLVRGDRNSVVFSQYLGDDIRSGSDEDTFGVDDPNVKEHLAHELARHPEVLLSQSTTIRLPPRRPNRRPVLGSQSTSSGSNTGGKPKAPPQYGGEKANECYDLKSGKLFTMQNTQQTQNSSTTENKNATASGQSLRQSPIKIVRIVGERHCGTKYLETEVKRHLKNVEVLPTLTRWKYWFQDKENVNERTQLASSLVINIVCDPYSWVSRMYSNPLHAPNHRSTTTKPPKSLTAFLQQEWSMPRPAGDAITPSVGTPATTTAADPSKQQPSTCQFHFDFNRVVPCKPASAKTSFKQYPVYEMNRDGSGAPYKSILELRKAKSVNYLELAQWVPNYVRVRLEDLEEEDNMNKFLIKIAEKYNLYACRSAKRKTAPFDHAEIQLNTENVKMITCALDWQVEKQIGYVVRKGSSLSDCTAARS